MKTKIAALLMAIMLLTLTACSTQQASSVSYQEASSSQQVEETVIEENTVEPIDITIAGLTGPTSIGMVKLMEDNKNEQAANNYNFVIAGSADEITPKLTQGEIDIAALPANLAAVLHQNTNGAVQMIAINTLGVLYIVENGETVQSIEDLKGKTIYCTGKGSTPEYTLRYILSENGIDPDTDVTLEWKTEPTEIVQTMAQSSDVVAMLPQPYVTIAGTQVENLRTALDLTSEWDALNNGSTLITGALVVRTEFAQQHPEQLAAFLKEYEQSTQWVNENVEDAAQLVEDFGIFKAAIAQKAIPYCNVVCITGDEMVATANGYFEILYNQNPKAIGGAMPSDELYYIA